MSEKAGKDLLLQVDVGGGSYSTLGGLMTTEYGFSNEEIVVTNRGSSQWKTILDEAGVRAMTISGSGVHNGDASTLDLVEDNCMDGTLTSFKILDNDSGRTYSGSFKITEFSRSGEESGYQEYSLSLASSGAITVS